MSQIGLKRYRLLFYGNIMDEADPQLARDALAKRYQLSDAQLETCFSGRKVALHKDLDEAEAYRIQSELEDAGLITHLELTHEQSPAQKPGRGAEPLLAPAPPARNTQAEQSSEALLAAAVMSQPARSINWGLWIVLALALAVIAVLTWLGLPLYRTLQLQQHVQTGLAQAEQVEAELTEFVARTGFLPNSNLDAGLGDEQSFASASVAGIRVGSKALIVVTFNPALERIGGDTLLLVPQRHDDGTVSWRCDGGSLDADLLPDSCRAPDASAYQLAESADPLAMPDLKKLAGAPASSAGPAPNYVKRVLMDEINNTGHIRRQLMQMKMLDVAWPQNNQEAGLPEGRKLGSHAFRRIEVQPEGRIMYEFSSAIQGFEGHKLFLVPSELGKWRCEASFPPEYMPENCSASL